MKTLAQTESHTTKLLKAGDFKHYSIQDKRTKNWRKKEKKKKKKMIKYNKNNNTKKNIL